MTVFQAYFDETGPPNAHSGTFRFVGLMSWHGFWPGFDKEWQNVLNAPPKLQYWHTTSAHHGELLAGDPPKPIEEGIRRQKEQGLAQVIGENADKMSALVVALDLQEHREHFLRSLDLHKQFRRVLGPRGSLVEHPLHVAMRVTVLLCVSMADAWNRRLFPGDPFHVWSIFEENESVADYEFDLSTSVFVLKRMLHPDDRKKIGPVIFLPSKGPLGQTTLQAVDLYAWHVNRIAETCKPESGWEHLEKVAQNTRRITPELLRSFAEALNQGQRPEC